VSPGGIFNPASATVGANQLTYTFTDINGCTNAANLAVTVNALPVVDAGINQTYCDTNLVVQLTGFTPTGGIWTGSNITSGGAINLGPLTPGNYKYYYTYTDGNGCDAVDSIEVIITAPTPSNAGIDFSVCINAAAVALNGLPAGGVWSGSGITGNSFNPTTAGVGSWPLSYTYGTGSCQSVDQLLATVNPLPIVIAGAPQSFCIDAGTQQLTGTPASGTWSGLGVSPGGIFNPASATVGANQLTYTFTDINGCTNAANVAITVNALPVVDAGQNLTFCDTNLVVQLTGGIPVNGIWTGSNVTTSGGLDLGPLTPGVYTYLYTFTDGNGCDEVDSIEVTITAPTPAIAGNDTTACIDAPLIALNGQPAGGVWSGQGISGNNFNPLLVGVGTWTLTYTYGTGTCQTNDQIVVTVFPLPVVDAGQQVAFCIDAGVQQLNGTPTGGSWTGIAATSAGLFDPQQAGVGSFTLYYSYSDINLCSNLDSVNVLVNALPIVNAGPDTSFCFQPISALLPTASPAGGTWTGPGVTNSSTGLFDPSLAGLGTHTIVYSFFDANGCSNSDSLLVTVINPANVNAGNDTAVCINSGTFVLSGIPSGGAWSGTLIQPNGQVDPNLAGTFDLVYTYGSGTCLRRDSLSLLVNPLPVLDLTGNIQVICVDQPAFALVAIPFGGTWAGPGVSGSTFNPGIAGAGNSTLIYSYTDLNGCSNVDSITITVNPLPVVFAGNDTTVCDLPSPVNFYGNFSNSGTWTGTGVNPSGVFLSPGVGTYDLVYSYTDANGCINRDTMLVTVVAPQIADAGPGDTVCVDAGSFFLPSFFPATGGTWSGPGIINSGTGLFDPALAFQNNTVTTAFTLFYSYGAGNCYTIDSTLIIIHPLPVVYAGIDIDTCISVSPFSLPGFNPFGGWWSGQGVVDSITGLVSPSVAGVGLHQLVYTYINPLTGCRNSDSLFFRVDPLPIPDFVIDTVLCVNNVYSPQNTSTGGAVWFWDFGNGVTSTLQFPSITYTAIGNYSILQVITSVEGCVDSIRQSVRVVEPPQPSFSLLPDEGCGPLEVIFTNTSSAYNPSYIWNFGNGQTDTSANPLPVTFLASLYNDTTYYITLSIANLCGSVSYTDSVLVHPSPTSYFGLNVNSGCSPLTISFSNNSYGLPTSYLWNFGDGSTSTDSLPAPHTYFAFANDTTYYITLITFNACGTDTLVDSIRVQPNTVNAFFNTNPTQGCAPLTVNFTNFSTGGSVYAWNFGDGNISSQYNATHTYLSAGLYTVSFVVTNNCSFDTAYVSIEVWPQPALAFSSSADTICAQAPIGFTNTSPDPLINILWDFGDGNQSTQTSPVHSYSQPGLYLVSFIGTGSVHGCIDTIYKNILVAPLPVADFDSLLNEGCQPLNLTFTNQSTGASSWYWDFGDGNFSSVYSPSHTYLNSGSFQVNLYLETALGCKDTSTGLVVVRPKPQSAFTLSQDSACGAPATIQLTNTSTPGTGADWTFGNGQQSTQISPSVTYNQTGLFNIQLISTNSFGCKDSAIDQFEVHVAPQAAISAADYNGCEDLLVTFINSTINGTSFYWDFGDGNTSTDVAVQHLYTEPGQYQVTLVASGAGGCVDTVDLASLITVFPGPEADFSFVQTSNPALYGLVDFYNASVDAISYQWDFDDTNTSSLENPTNRFENVGIYNIELIAISANGCTDTMVKPLDLNYFDGLQVPNAFAPEGDQPGALYSRFAPQGISLQQYRLEIYDTWGVLIWSTEELRDGKPAEGWDGKKDGVDLPGDVYVWKIDARFMNGVEWPGQQREGNAPPRKTGTVTLIR
jgi:PKD repeat protein